MAEDLNKEKLQEEFDKHLLTFASRVPDWDAFEDAQTEGFKRAQHRYVGAGASGKFGDNNTVEAGAFTVSVMYVPPGQGTTAHTHGVEEVFFMLDGQCTFFFENEKGDRVERNVEPLDCVWSPPNVLHGFVNKSTEACYLQVMVGKGRPEPYKPGE